jgi:immune inhibitor InhA-like protein
LNTTPFFLRAARSAVPHAVLLLALVACATGETIVPGNGGNGGDAQGGAGLGGAGGGGGSGPCGVDCSMIMTPACSKAVCNEGQFVGPVGQCVVVDEDDGVSCDDGQFCTVNDVCVTGDCKSDTQNLCGLTPAGCELITCDEPSMMCSKTAGGNGDPCTPADLCQINGHCANGLCNGQPKDCFFAPVPNECYVANCNSQNGMCEPEVDPTKLGQPCTGDVCTVNQTCDAMGNCIGGQPKDCSAFTVGCENGVCDQATGICFGQPVPPGGQCFDGIDDCNTGTCDNMANCVPSPLPDGTMCNDFNTCTAGDLCTAGNCAGMPVNGCTTYFEEYFETCVPPGWTLSGDWQCGAPTPVPAYQGNNAIATIIAGDYHDSMPYATNYAQTPPIDLSTATQPVLSFRAWIQTEPCCDGFNVKISTNGGASFSVLENIEPPYNGNIAGENCFIDDLSALGYRLMIVDLGAYVGQQVILRFSFNTDSSVVYDGIQVDEVKVQEANQVQLAIDTTTVPNGFVNQPYVANIQRSGGSAAAVWSITGGTNNGWLGINPTSGQLSGTPALANLGQVTVNVHVEEPLLPSNFDDAQFVFDVQQAIYAQQFEGPCPNGWTFGGDWQCGVPSFVGPSAAFSGTQCIATQIAGNYNNNQSFSVCNATSPPINLAGTVNPQLSFMMWLQTEGFGFDGINVKVSTNGGVSYSVVNTVTPAYWDISGGQSVWNDDHSMDGWQMYTADLTAYAGQTVLVRFSFNSDGSVTYAGPYIDDVVVAD